MSRFYFGLLKRQSSDTRALSADNVLRPLLESALNNTDYTSGGVFSSQPMSECTEPNLPAVTLSLSLSPIHIMIR